MFKFHCFHCLNGCDSCLNLPVHVALESVSVISRFIGVLSLSVNNAKMVVKCIPLKCVKYLLLQKESSLYVLSSLSSTSSMKHGPTSSST